MLSVARTVNFLNIRTPKKFVVITLKFELCGSVIESDLGLTVCSDLSVQKLRNIMVWRADLKPTVVSVCTTAVDWNHLDCWR